VENFSVRKINALFDVALKNDNQKNHSIGVAMRMGMNATAREFEQWVRGV